MYECIWLHCDYSPLYARNLSRTELTWVSWGKSFELGPVGLLVVIILFSDVLRLDSEDGRSCSIVCSQNRVLPPWWVKGRPRLLPRTCSFNCWSNSFSFRSTPSSTTTCSAYKTQQLCWRRLALKYLHHAKLEFKVCICTFNTIISLVYFSVPSPNVFPVEGVHYHSWPCDCSLSSGFQS